MSQLAPIFNALRLPVTDVDALIQGQMIAAIPQTFLRPGQQFALYADNPNLDAGNVLVKAWARCELCQPIDSSEALGIISRLTIWTTDTLQEIFTQRGTIWLAYLRVYLFPNAFEIPVNPTGNFVSFPYPISITESLPVLSEQTFAMRRKQLEQLEPSENPELENLQISISQIAITNPTAKALDEQIQVFLGWQEAKNFLHPSYDIGWISKIADIGNSSDGNEFEKQVRKSLIKLGFSNSSSNENLKDSLNPERTGGAGGLDFYCDTPYPIVGECKATKTDKVPDGTAAQLIKLGYKHLQEQYDCCIKIILAAGELTEDAEKTASGNKMNVIRPETLQRLVELKAKHPGSIDLLALKPCLAEKPFGEAADGKLNRYIDTVWNNIKLRSHLIQLVKNANREVGIEYLSGRYDASNPPKPIFNLQEMHEILVELSSPLTGYLGREKGSDWRSDRFYFLRDLIID